MNDPLLSYLEWSSRNPGTMTEYQEYCQQYLRTKIPVAKPVETCWTRDEISEKVNAGVQIVLNDDDLYLSGQDVDLVRLVVNAALSMFDNDPPATLDTVIERNYQPNNECMICGERLTEADGVFKHTYTTNVDHDHEPVPETVTAMVRGWIGGLE